MSFLYDYGEGLLCFVPVFAIIALVFLGLLWNSLPSRQDKDKK